MSLKHASVLPWSLVSLSSNLSLVENEPLAIVSMKIAQNWLKSTLKTEAEVTQNTLVVFKHETKNTHEKLTNSCFSILTLRKPCF